MHHFAKVNRVAEQLESQRSRIDGFCLRGVRTGAFSAIAPEDPPAVFTVKAAEEGSQNGTQGGKPRREKIPYVVQLCGGASEIQIFVVFVADHAVKRVDGLVAEAKRSTADCKVKQRGDHTVRAVLRHRFHSGLRHALLREAFGVAADNHRDGPPCRG